MMYTVIPLGELLNEEYDQEKLQQSFQKFSCQREADLENFLKNKAILYENADFGKTYLILDTAELKKENFVVMAYFTIAQKSVDISAIPKKQKLHSPDPVKGLDVSILQENLLAPVLGIQDPRTDKRIDFVGGIRGLGELERRVSEDMTAAFSMCATSISELLSVADAGLLMPPKSTWFEPKLRSGLFIHRLS